MIFKQDRNFNGHLGKPGGSRCSPSGLFGPAGPEEAGMNSEPRGLPGTRSLGNGAGTDERQLAPPAARAAEPQEAVGGTEVTYGTSGVRGRGSGSLSRDLCSQHGSKDSWKCNAQKTCLICQCKEN